MEEGALVLADCLGFRGIWSRFEPQMVIAKMREVEETLSSNIKALEDVAGFAPHVRFHFRLLSDTIAFSVQYRKGAHPHHSLVSYACGLAAKAAHLFMESEVAIPLRGCISYGPHLAEGNLLVGPAVDEAAENMNEPDGAFIWVLPSAVAQFETLQGNIDLVIEHYPMPTKRGVTLDANLVNPLWMMKTETESKAGGRAIREVYLWESN